jgi:hypothetical protein
MTIHFDQIQAVCEERNTYSIIHLDGFSFGFCACSGACLNDAWVVVVETWSAHAPRAMPCNVLASVVVVRTDRLASSTVSQILRIYLYAPRRSIDQSFLFSFLRANDPSATYFNFTWLADDMFTVLTQL